jgi:hypothetical protein
MNHLKKINVFRRKESCCSGYIFLKHSRRQTLAFKKASYSVHLCRLSLLQAAYNLSQK